jgi:hypothetical protein
MTPSQPNGSVNCCTPDGRALPYRLWCFVVARDLQGWLWRDVDLPLLPIPDGGYLANVHTAGLTPRERDQPPFDTVAMLDVVWDVSVGRWAAVVTSLKFTNAHWGWVFREIFPDWSVHGTPAAVPSPPRDPNTPVFSLLNQENQVTKKKAMTRILRALYDYNSDRRRQDPILRVRDLKGITSGQLRVMKHLGEAVIKELLELGLIEDRDDA